jgi:hypothetical protein
LIEIFYRETFREPSKKRILYIEPADDLLIRQFLDLDPILDQETAAFEVLRRSGDFFPGLS